MEARPINEIIAEALDKLVINSKTIFNVDDVAKYTGHSKGTIYNLVSKREIPHYKALGKLYFKRSEIDQWLTKTDVATKRELSVLAAQMTRN